LMDLQRAARSLRGERGLPVSDGAQAPAAHASDEAWSQAFDHRASEPAAEDSLRLPHEPARNAATPFCIADRNHAYRLLDEIAQYLAKAEPHSPTPYLLRRAVAWGGMPLPELMREVVSQEGDLNRYFAMLGVHE